MGTLFSGFVVGSILVFSGAIDLAKGLVTLAPELILMSLQRYTSVVLFPCHVLAGSDLPSREPPAGRQ
jgi:hypothetical protein